MSSLSWCKEQSRGINIINPNDNLSEDYFDSAEKTMKMLRAAHKLQDNMWLATTKYYVEYFAVYSVLMKLGIKCEIHDCTLSLIKLLEKEGVFKEGCFAMLESDKELRVDNQYYLKNKEVVIDFEKLSNFLLEVKEINQSLNVERISKIRDLVKKTEN